MRAHILRLLNRKQDSRAELDFGQFVPVRAVALREALARLNPTPRGALHFWPAFRVAATPCGRHGALVQLPVWGQGMAEYGANLLRFFAFLCFNQQACRIVNFIKTIHDGCSTRSRQSGIGIKENKWYRFTNVRSVYSFSYKRRSHFCKKHRNSKKKTINI